ncbi:MAG: nuclear transport factor 2 family protein [Saprospiraceae bacterium]
MKITFITINMKFSLLLIFAVASFNGIQAQTTTENNLKQLEKLRFEAMVNEDTSFLKTVISDDLIYLHSNGLQETKAEHLKNVSTKHIDYQEMIPQEMQFRIYEGAAIGNGVVLVKGSLGDKNFTLFLKYSDVYIHTKRGWKLANWQSTKLDDYKGLQLGH